LKDFAFLGNFVHKLENRGTNYMNNNRILKNAIILFVAMAITKLIGAALKIPLTNILGGLGMGYFSTAYSLFSPIYAVTAAALPTVIMRLTAQQAANGAGSYRNVRRIRKAGLIAAFGLGLSGCAGILIIAKPFSTYIAGSPNSLPAMLVIAPSLFFCSISAVYKGYYEGLSNMIPTAISQIIEASIKSGLGILFAILLMPLGIPYAAAGAIAAITIAEFAGLIFLWLKTRFGDIEYNSLSVPSADTHTTKLLRKRVIIKTIITDSLPIAVAALAMNLNPFIDMMTIPTIINASIINNKQFFLQNFTYGVHGGEAISDIGSFIYGSYTGITIPIFALATTVTAMVCKSALPEITSAWQQQDSHRLTHALRLLFKGTFIIGLPICFGLAALAEPILSLLYFSKPAEVLVSTPPLIALGLGGVSLLLSATLFGIFLAIGRVDLQIKLMLAGAVIKLAANIILIRSPHINVTGAAISTVACYTFIGIVGLSLLYRLLNGNKASCNKGGLKNLEITRCIVQPLVFAMLCGLTAYICYHHVFAAGHKFGVAEHTAASSEVLQLAMSIAAGALVYLTLTMISDRKYIKNMLPTKGA